jgi:hypothetical protein
MAPMHSPFFRIGRPPSNALKRHTQERNTSTGDHIFVGFAFPPTQRRGAGLGHRNVTRSGRGTIKSLQPQKMAAIVNDGNCDRPVVGYRFRLCCGSR